MRTALLKIAAGAMFAISFATLFAVPVAAQFSGLEGLELNDTSDFGSGGASDNSFLEKIINVSINPQYPHPREKVTIKLTSSYVDLRTSNIIWTIGSEVMESAIGDAEFELTAGKLGETTIVTATIEPYQGAPQTKEVIITPTDVDIIWEGDTFIPPFYRGKSMYTQMSDLRVIAIPHILSGETELPAEDLVYKWKVNGGVSNKWTGYGKTMITIPAMTRPVPVIVEVTASTLDGTQTASRRITVPLVPPKILFYENHPLYGVMLNRALVGDTVMEGEEMTIVARPYFFSANDAVGLDRSWSMNGRDIESQTEWEMTLRNAENVSGTSNVEISVRHLERILQRGEGGLTIHFSEKDKEPVI